MTVFVSGDPHGTWFSVSGVDYEYVSGVDYEYVSRTSTRVYEKACFVTLRWVLASEILRLFSMVHKKVLFENEICVS